MTTTVSNKSEVVQSGTTISIDAMGGDLGPAAIVAGLVRVAKKNKRIHFLLHGRQEQLQKLVTKRLSLKGRVTIIDSLEVIKMEDKPSHVVRHGKATSMWSAIDSVRNGNASVCVSCGNTGALMAISMVRLRKLNGVNRPAIAILWPSSNPMGFNVMLDVGADVRADPKDLLQYALMGVSYARNGLGIAKPRVGLLNVGTEEHKGRSELKEAYSKIEHCQLEANFVFEGFVEGGDIPGSKVDVIVTDGFTGNVALKTAEGTASLIGYLLREAFRFSPLSKLTSILAFTSLNRFKMRIDPRRVNGGVFLGLNGTVVKSHGSADATGIEAAIKLAFELSKNDFLQKVAARVAYAGAIDNDVYDDANK